MRKLSKMPRILAFFDERFVDEKQWAKAKSAVLTILIGLTVFAGMTGMVKCLANFHINFNFFHKSVLY